MKLSHPIRFDLLEFLKFGKLDFIKVGQTKEWILANFADPDGLNNKMLSHKWPVWTYDLLEFHFDQNNELFLIYTDYLEDLKSNNRFEISPWIFEDASKLTLLFVLAALNSQQIDYQKVTRKKGVLLHLTSGVTLSFTATDEALAKSANDWMMTSLSLTRADEA
ncbi:hypothetical protein QMK33_20990 [Hymenobacter sp. H14-R3]|uniref:hypothetical protein n=1 Tax=Hymenobacter sp. H14-R3 TaxID=3046308 RepID=UPI0024B9E6BA|nr:hypothetical protein [Hymenobacter sp. H14-R3]MDJ0367630.1 hypothetical protein [Hymenobacter sp. H14-R3]